MSEWVFIIGAGYVGSHIAATLQDSTEFNIMLIDHRGNSLQHSTRYCNIYADEDLSSDVVLDAVRTYQPSFLINCVDDPSFENGIQNPFSAWETNVTKPLKLLEACRSSGVMNILSISTAEIYANSTDPIDETCHSEPLRAYSRAKLGIEHVLKDCYTGYGMNSISFRTFNIAGSHPLYDIGWLPGSPYVMHKLMDSARVGQRFEIHGKDHLTKDGTPVRDYLHVMDLSNAVVESMKWLPYNPGAHLMNLGSGIGTSVQELINLTEELLGTRINYSYGEKKPWEPSVRVANIQKATSTIGWKPTRTIQDMIKDGYKWSSSHVYADLAFSGIYHGSTKNSG